MASRNGIRWVPSLVMMGAIYYLSSLPSSEIPRFGPMDMVIKKGGHALGFGLLAISYAFALRRESLSKRGLFAALSLAILYALIDEYHQSFVAGRSSRLVDVLIDSLGAASAMFLLHHYSSNSNSNSRS